jgi:hypothetical protein
VRDLWSHILPYSLYTLHILPYSLHTLLH